MALQQQMYYQHMRAQQQMSIMNSNGGDINQRMWAQQAATVTATQPTKTTAKNSKKSNYKFHTYFPAH